MVIFSVQIVAKIVFDYLRLNLNAGDMVLMCNIAAKCQFASRAVCAYAHDFRKQPECALTGACTLIIPNMVILLQNWCFKSFQTLSFCFKNTKENA